MKNFDIIYTEVEEKQNTDPFLLRNFIEKKEIY